MGVLELSEWCGGKGVIMDEMEGQVLLNVVSSQLPQFHFVDHSGEICNNKTILLHGMPRWYQKCQDFFIQQSCVGLCFVFKDSNILLE